MSSEGFVSNFDDLAARFMSQYAPFIRRPKQSIEMMKCRQRREESLNDYIARFIILLAFRSALNDDKLENRRFKEDDGWINIHHMDDVRQRAERFTASENFKHVAVGLRGDRQEKKNSGSMVNSLTFPTTVRTGRIKARSLRKKEATGRTLGDLSSGPSPSSHP
ncbi:unnamed protein product [Amaranthus hypochondriacus]